MAEFTVPRRCIHLDFHTGPQIPDVAADFDAGEFAETFRRAHVDSVALFAICHHGHAYWNTEHPSRHPGLPPGFGLLEKQVEALHKVNIKPAFYISVQCNEFCANTHPEWLALDPTGKPVNVKGDIFTPSWQILDMSSPYQDYLAELLAEVLERFAPFHRLSMDMCWDQPSCSKWALAGMKRNGLDPRLEAERRQYARLVAHQYMKRYRDMVEAAHRHKPPAGVWFNSRPKTNLFSEKQFLRHVHIEALPTGGWGYSYMPYVARIVRHVNLPTIGFTGRFFKGWGDNSSLKPEMALKYECCSCLAQNISVGVGDLLHPRGRLHPEIYALIGKVYAHIEKCEPFIQDCHFVNEVAALVDLELGDRPGDAPQGLVRMLTQLQQQFDLVPTTADFSAYKVLIVPENIRPQAELRDKLRDFVHAGGKLILTGAAALELPGQAFLPEQGVEVFGESPYSATFIHAGAELRTGLADYPFVIYDRGFRIKARAGATVWARIGEPYFDRTYEHFSGHSYTPEGRLSEYDAIVENAGVVTISFPLFGAYARHGAPCYRRLLGNVLKRLQPRPLVEADGPSVMQTSLLRNEKHTVVHVLSFPPGAHVQNLEIIEDTVPLVDVPIRVRLDSRPRQVMLQPHAQRLEFAWLDGYAEVKLTLLDGHGILVFDH